MPLDQKNKLTWNRNIDKEDRLVERLGIKCGEKFALVHKVDSRNEIAVLPPVHLRIIEIVPVEGYKIVDWFGVAKLATEIYVIESAVHQFLDGVVNQLTENRFILSRPCVENGYRFTVSSNWKLDYVGKLIKG